MHAAQQDAAAHPDVNTLQVIVLHAFLAHPSSPHVCTVNTLKRTIHMCPCV
jgi:hypothetical protein